MTPAAIIAEARDLIQDSATPHRYSDDMMLRFTNNALSRAAILRPDLFGVVGQTPLVVGTSLQSCPTGAIRLVELFRVVGGLGLTETSRVALSRYRPQWMSDVGRPVNFMRYPRNPTKFFIYPIPAEEMVVEGEWAMSPAALEMNALAPLPDAYLPVIVDGVVALAEIIDNEHVDNGRAKFFAERFEQTLIAGLKVREISDNEHAGMEPDIQRSTKTSTKTYLP